MIQDNLYHNKFKVQKETKPRKKPRIKELILMKQR